MNTTHKAVLAEGPINSTLVRLTIPMIVGLIGMVAFNLIDSFFIGQLDADRPGALAALGFTLPVVMILGAIGMGISMGASAVVSRAIGEGNQRQVRRLTMDSLSLAVSIAAVFVVIGLLTIDPLFRLLGAEGEVLEMVKEYMVIWYSGVIFVIVPFVGNSCIRANGDTRSPAILMFAMILLNTILDPLLIFGYGPFPRMEIEGAALATFLSRALSLVLAIFILYRQNMLTRVIIPKIQELIASWKRVLHIGLPAAATNLVVPLTTALITRLVSTYGDPAVGGLGVSSRIDLFAIMVVVALSTVMGPYVGQNLGAGKLDRLKIGVWRSQKFSILWGLGMFVLFELSAPWIAPIFSKDPEVIDVIVLYLRIAPFGYAARCVYALGNTILNILDRPLTASAITLIQMFVVYLPMAYLGSYLFGLGGIFGAMALAYFTGGTVSFLLVRKEIRKLFATQTHPSALDEQPTLPISHS